MKYQSVPVWINGRPVYLAELVLALGWPTWDLTWRCASLEAGAGEDAAALEQASGDNRVLTTFELLHVVTPDVQIVDGEVTGFAGAAGRPPVAVVFRAVDSTSWDIQTADDADYRSIRRAFPQAADLDPGLFGPSATDRSGFGARITRKPARPESSLRSRQNGWP